MRFARFEGPDRLRYVGRVEGDELVPLSRDAQGRIVELAMARDERARGVAPAVPLEKVRLLSPVGEPPSVRDFYAFEQHVQTARKLRGLEMDPDWYELPIFYFTNPATIFGPQDVIPYPSSTQELDYELEFAFVIGREGTNLSREQALDAIAGFTIFNDFSARDLQRREMKLSLGPAKGKDFASSFGPFLVTPDEFCANGEPKGSMVARVNGVEYSRGDQSDLYHNMGDMIAYASRDSRVRVGDVMGSGTVGTGCILELGAVHGPERYPWLEPGDAVELEVEGLGTLRNVIGARAR